MLTFVADGDESCLQTWRGGICAAFPFFLCILVYWRNIFCLNGITRRLPVLMNYASSQIVSSIFIGSMLHLFTYIHQWCFLKMRVSLWVTQNPAARTKLKTTKKLSRLIVSLRDSFDIIHVNVWPCIHIFCSSQIGVSVVWFPTPGNFERRALEYRSSANR